MVSKRNPPAPAYPHSIPSFLTPAFWQHVVDTLKLSPQQGRILSMILQGKQDKEMAAALRVSRYTVRCYLRRLFERQGMEGRMQLVLRELEMSAGGQAQAAAERAVGVFLAIRPQRANGTSEDTNASLLVFS